MPNAYTYVLTVEMNILSELNFRTRPQKSLRREKQKKGGYVLYIQVYPMYYKEKGEVACDAVIGNEMGGVGWRSLVEAHQLFFGPSAHWVQTRSYTYPRHMMREGRIVVCGADCDARAVFFFRHTSSSFACKNFRVRGYLLVPPVS